MRDNKGYNRSGGHRGYGKRSFNNNRDRYGSRDRQMFDVVCSNCGKNCQVPFNPTGDKPVYCNDCFAKNGGSDRGRSDSRSSRDNSRSGQGASSEQLDAINKKLDSILEFLNNLEVMPADSLDEVGIEEVVEEESVEPKKEKTAKKSKPKTKK